MVTHHLQLAVVKAIALQMLFAKATKLIQIRVMKTVNALPGSAIKMYAVPMKVKMAIVYLLNGDHYPSLFLL